MPEMNSDDFEALVAKLGEKLDVYVRASVERIHAEDTGWPVDDPKKLSRDFVRDVLTAMKQ